jgi:hypothetical protein
MTTYSAAVSAATTSTSFIAMMAGNGGGLDRSKLSQTTTTITKMDVLLSPKGLL